MKYSGSQQSAEREARGRKAVATRRNTLKPRQSRLSNASVLIDTGLGSRDLILYPPLTTIGELVALNMFRTNLDESESRADVCIIGNGPDGPIRVGIEVSSVSDFISKLNTKRLQATQVPAMLDTYDKCWVVTYGDMREGPSGTLQRPSGRDKNGNPVWTDHKLGSRTVYYALFQAATIELANIGIHHYHLVGTDRQPPGWPTQPSHPRFSPGLAAVAKWIAGMAGWWCASWSSHELFKGVEARPQLRIDLPNDKAKTDEYWHLKLKIAEALPGVHTTIAYRAAERWRTPREMIMAAPDEWAKIERVGKVIAREIDEKLGPNEWERKRRR